MSKTRRRELRLSDADEDLIVEAAGLAGVTVTEFLLDRALSDAETIVRRHRLIEFDDAERRRRFIEALDAPFERNEAFAAQARKARPLEFAD